MFWFDGRGRIAKRAVSEGAFEWRPESEGILTIRVIEDHGGSAERDVHVHFAE